MFFSCFSGLGDGFSVFTLVGFYYSFFCFFVGYLLLERLVVLGIFKWVFRRRREKFDVCFSCVLVMIGRFVRESRKGEGGKIV